MENRIETTQHSKAVQSTSRAVWKVLEKIDENLKFILKGVPEKSDALKSKIDINFTEIHQFMEHAE